MFIIYELVVYLSILEDMYKFVCFRIVYNSGKLEIIYMFVRGVVDIYIIFYNIYVDIIF